MQFPTTKDNIHLLAASSIFGRLDVPPAAVAGIRNLILVCFTNRCGSWLLVDLLATSGRMFVAGECLNGNEVAVAAQSARLRSFGAFVESQIARPAIDGNVVLKCGILHLELLGRSGLLDLLGDRIRFVHIERLDRLGQAISWEIAVQTDLWRADAARPVRTDPVYSFKRIAEAMDRFAEDNRQFDLFFGRNDIVTRHVTYEALTRNPAAVAAGVVEGLFAAPPAFDMSRVTFRQQATSRNEEWRRRFITDLQSG